MKTNLKDLRMLQEIELNLTSKLKEILPDILKKANKILLEKYEYKYEFETTVQSLHGIIGSKNNTFVDSIRTQFIDPNDFIARWLNGNMEKSWRESERILVIYRNNFLSSDINHSRKSYTSRH